MTNSEVMKGYKIKAKIKTVFQGEIILIGIVREFKGKMICCNQEGTGKPFFCYEHEILSYEIKIPPNTKTVILNTVSETK